MSAGRTQMKRLAATVMSLSLLVSVCAGSESSQEIKVTRRGSQPSRQGPDENFTGSVRIDPLFNANAPSRTSRGRAPFEPGARTAWHTHPLGQTLVVTAGYALGPGRGGATPVRRAGDVLWITRGQKHG